MTAVYRLRRREGAKMAEILTQIPKLGNRPRPRPRFIGLLRRERADLLGNYFVPLV